MPHLSPEETAALTSILAELEYVADLISLLKSAQVDPTIILNPCFLSTYTLANARTMATFSYRLRCQLIGLNPPTFLDLMYAKNDTTGGGNA